MEYGEAISSEALERAVAIARELLTAAPDAGPAAAEAVSRAYCVCVVGGEDAAEQRLSGVHRTLIESVAERTSAAVSSSARDELPFTGDEEPG